MSGDSPQTALDAALEFAARGWFCFPVNPTTKRPLIENNLERASCDEGQLREWFEVSFPQAAIGIACGPSRLVVVDLDVDPTKDKNGEAAFKGLAAGRRHGAALEASTPRGGRHLYFADPSSTFRCNASGLVAKGVDVRAEGGYVVAPSTASPGREWIAGDFREPLDEPPAWLAEVLPKDSSEKEEKERTAPATGGASDAELAQGAAMLLELPVAALEYDDWRNAIWAFAQFVKRDPRGAKLAEAWSAIDGERFKPGEALKYFTSGNGKIGGGTLVHLVEEHRAKIALRDESDSEPGLTWSELLALPPVEWLLDGILPVASVVVLAGHPGTGKSFVAIDWAASIASGRSEWMGRSFAHHGPVLYLALEGQPGFGGRTQAWKVGHPDSLPDHPDDAIEVMNWKAVARPLTASGQGILRRRIAGFVKRRGRVALFVVDTFGTALGGDENDAVVVCEALAAVTQIAEEFKCTVLLLHHLRKDQPGSKESGGQSAVRGSGAIVGNVDQVLGLEHRDGRKLTVLKAKDAAGNVEVGFDLQELETGRTLSTGRAETSCIVVPPVPVGDRQSREDIARNLLTAEKRRKIVAASRRLKKAVGKDALCQEAGVGPAGRGGGRALIERMVAFGDLVSIAVGKDRAVYAAPELVPEQPAATPHTHPHPKGTAIGIDRPAVVVPTATDPIDPDRHGSAS